MFVDIVSEKSGSARERDEENKHLSGYVCSNRYEKGEHSETLKKK